jgi:hypothetical protein
MKHALVLVALVLAMICHVAAQKPVSSTDTPTTYAMTVKGRIDARHLIVSDAEAAKLPFTMLRGTEFRLNGSRDILRRVRDHNGHCDELAGVVSVPPERRPVVPSVEAKDLGPFSVGIGNRGSTRVDKAPRVLALKVESVTHLDEACAESPRPQGAR